MTGLPDYDLALRQALAVVDAISDTRTVESAGRSSAGRFGRDLIAT